MRPGIRGQLQIKFWVRTSAAMKCHDSLEASTKSQHPSAEMFFLHPFSVGRGENKIDFEAGQFPGVSEEVKAHVKHLAEHGTIFSLNEVLSFPATHHVTKHCHAHLFQEKKFKKFIIYLLEISMRSSASSTSTPISPLIFPSASSKPPAMQVSEPL